MASQIIESPEYAEQINRFGVDWKRLDAALTSVQPALLSSPEIFPAVPGTKLQRVLIVGFSGVPPLSIFFHVDGEKLYIDRAELIRIDE